MLLGECLGGALYTEDFRRMMVKLGCNDYRLTSRTRITLNNAQIAKQVGLIEFYSMTVRAFKLDLEDRCEDFGQMAIYKGGITDSQNAFMLDDHHLFEKGKPAAVCGNTAAMLKSSRYGEFFEIIGDTNHHFGLFDCAPAAATSGATADVGACC